MFFVVFVLFLLFAGNNQNSCSKLGNLFVIGVGDHEQMINKTGLNVTISYIASTETFDDSIFRF